MELSPKDRDRLKTALLLGVGVLAAAGMRSKYFRNKNGDSEGFIQQTETGITFAGVYTDIDKGQYQQVTAKIIGDEVELDDSEIQQDSVDRFEAVFARAAQDTHQ